MVRINRPTGYVHSVYWSAVAFLAVFLVIFPPSSPLAGTPEAVITNVIDKGNRIWITYDLQSPEPVEVSLAGETFGDAPLPIKIEALAGDVGRFVEPGPNRVIEWMYLEDYPGGLEGVEVVLELSTQPCEPPPPKDSTSLTCAVAPLAGYLGDPGSDVRSLQFALQAAKDSGVDIVVVEIDGIGESVPTAVAMFKALDRWRSDNPRMRVVGFVRGEAAGTAIFPLFACEAIYMTEKSKVGAPAADDAGTETVTLPEGDLAAGQGANLAAKAGIDSQIIRAMFKPDVNLYIGKEWSGGKIGVVSQLPRSFYYMGLGEYRPLSEEGSTLRLSAPDAVDTGVARAIVGNIPELMGELGVERWRIDNSVRRALVRSELDTWKALSNYEGVREDIQGLLAELEDEYTDADGRRQVALELEELIGELEQGVNAYPAQLGALVKEDFNGGIKGLKAVAAKALPKVKSVRIKKAPKKKPKRVARARRTRKVRPIRRPPTTTAPT